MLILTSTLFISHWTFEGLISANIYFQQLLFLSGFLCRPPVVLRVPLLLSQSPLCLEQPVTHLVQGSWETRVQLRLIFTQLKQ